MANFLRKTAERIGKAIPNEVSKLNSFSKFLPYPFNLIPQSISSYDSAATAYGDTGSIGTTFQAGANPFLGSSQDPGQYGAGYMRTGRPTPGDDWFNKIGQIGNFIPSNNPNSMAGGTSQKFLTPDQLAYQNNANTAFDIQNMLKMFNGGQGQSQGQSQMSESELMMKQIRSLYAQYLFSQNQAAINPSGSFGVTTTANLYPKL